MEYEIKYYLDYRNTQRPINLQTTKISDPTNFCITMINRLIGERVAYALNWYVNIILRDDVRQRIRFIEGDEQAPFVEWTKKNKIMNPIKKNNDYGGYKITYSTESHSDKEDLNDRNINYITLCVRISFELESTKTLDITLIKRTTLNNLTKDRKDFIYSFKNVGDAPFSLVDWIEYEVEFSYECTTHDAEEVYNVLLADEVNINRSMLISDVAYLIGNHYFERFKEFWNIGQWGFNKLLPKAKEISLDEWNSGSYDITNMTLRTKLRGERRVVYIDERTSAIYSIGGTSCEIIGYVDEDIKGPWVIDCELYNHEYYILHPLVWEGNSLWKLDDYEALREMKHAWNSAPDFIRSMQLCPVIKMKPDNAKKQLLDLKKKVDDFEGFLLGDIEGNYWKQRVIKWKNPEESTFDFMVTKCPDQLYGKKPYVTCDENATLYLLWGYISYDDFRAMNMKFLPGQDKIFGQYRLNKKLVPVVFSPADNPTCYIYEDQRLDLEGTIVEMQYSEGWILKHIRQDRKSIMFGGSDMGNYYKVLLDIWSKLKNPFLFKYLYSKPNRDEPNSSKDVIYHILDSVDFETITLFNVPDIIINKEYQCKILIIQSRGSEIKIPINHILKDPRCKFIEVDAKYQGLKEIPSDFIGGSDVLLTCNVVGKISVWAKHVSSLVKHGGQLIVIADEKELDALQDELSKHGFADVDIYDYADAVYGIWERKFNAEVKMTRATIAKENPHLRNVVEMLDAEVDPIEENSFANFKTKFTRVKTKECLKTLKAHEPYHLLDDIDRGLLLCDIEFLNQVPKNAQLYYYNCEWPHILKKLFPSLVWIDEPDDSNTEVLICHNYRKGLKFLENYSPNMSLLMIDITKRTESIIQVLQGRMIFIPYQPFGNGAVMLQLGKISTNTIWNIRPGEFAQEMNYFHQVMRIECYYYKKPILASHQYDCCYDCKAEVYILMKYIRAKRTQLNIEQVVNLLRD